MLDESFIVSHRELLNISHSHFEVEAAPHPPQITENEGIGDELWLRDVFGTEPPRVDSRSGAWLAQYRRMTVALKHRACWCQGDLNRLSDRVMIVEARVDRFRKLHHPNILVPLGLWSNEHEPPCSVTPWMEHGNVLHYLQEAPHASRLRLVLGVAQALDYLHSLNPPILHGNLRATKVLIGPDGEPRVTDYGLYDVMDELDVIFYDSDWGEIAQKLRWRAPETASFEDYGFQDTVESMTPASDVYSFGSLVYEIYSGSCPFFGTTNPYLLPGLIAAGTRPSRVVAITSPLFDEMWDMMEECWRLDYESRPTVAQLVQRLQSYADDPESSIRKYESSAQSART